MKISTTDGQLTNSIRRHLLLALATVVALMGTVVLWAAFTNLASAVVVSGQFVVDSYVKKVQHPTGGVVSEIRVREGQEVSAGDVVMRLDSTQAQAAVAIVTKRHDELAARLARLEAERDDHDAIAFPPWLRDRSEDPVVSATISSEIRLFDFRKRSREGRKAQLRERIAQLQFEIEGLKAQEIAYQQGSEVLEEEINALGRLREQKIVSDQRLNSLKTQFATFRGERGEKIAFQAQAAGRISETRLQILQIEQEFKTEVSRELRQVQAELGEVIERRVSAEDNFKRLTIIAPQSGFVHQLSAHTVNGVINPSDPVMLIVPKNDQMAVEVRVQPRDIDQLYVGQRVLLRLTAFNLRNTPELDGTVNLVAADLTTDPQSGSSYYLVRLAVQLSELRRIKGLAIVPGMPVEAFIHTGDRTALSYLLKPLSDLFHRAFREE